jgi:hypothetical protein
MKHTTGNTHNLLSFFRLAFAHFLIIYCIIHIYFNMFRVPVIELYPTMQYCTRPRPRVCVIL